MELRKELKELSKKPKNTQEPKTLHRSKQTRKSQNCKHPEKKHLESMLKTISTEKLHLERQLSQLTVRNNRARSHRNRRRRNRYMRLLSTIVRDKYIHQLSTIATSGKS